MTLSLSLVLVHVGYMINGRYSSDVYHHAAAIDRLAASLTDPRNPLVGGTRPDPSFSPYNAGLGIVSRLTGASGLDLLPWAGLLLVVAFLLLWPRAIVALVGDVRAAPIALLLTLVAWGLQPWRWSGYLNLNSVGFGLGYPSVAAWVALLGGLAVGRRLREAETGPRILLLGLLLAFITLTHPITLIGAAPLIIGTMLDRPESARHVRALLGVLLVAAAAVAAWPLYSVLDLLGSGATAFDASNRLVYDQLPARTFLALPGAMLLVVDARRGVRRPLVATAAIAGCVVAAGWTSERWTAGRALPFLIFACHLSLARAVLDRLVATGASRLARRATAGAVISVCAVGTIGSAPGIVAAMPRDLLPAAVKDDRRLRPEAHEFDFLAPFGTEDAVVLAWDRAAARGALAYGFVSVATPYPSPYMDDAEQAVRFRDVQSYRLRSERRPELIRRYGITHVIAGQADQVDLRDHVRLGAGSGFVLYGVREPGA